MNRLNIGPLGGFPLTSDELVFIEDSAKMVSAFIVNGLIESELAVKLQGVGFDVSGSGGSTPVLNVSAGAIFYQDEVFAVDSFSTPLPSGNTLTDVYADWYFDLASTTGTPVTYENATVNDAYKYRKAILTTSPATWVLGSNIKTLREVLEAKPATTSEFGTVKFATLDEAKSLTSTAPIALAPANFIATSFDITTANSLYTQVSNVNAKTLKIGDFVQSTGTFTVTCINSAINKFELNTSISNAFSNVITTAAGYSKINGFAFEMLVGRLHLFDNTNLPANPGNVLTTDGNSFGGAVVSEGDFEVWQWLTNTIHIMRGDGLNWRVGDSLAVYFSCSYINL